MSDEPTINVRKIGAVVPVSNELLMDYGLIPDTRPPRPPLTRRQRFRVWRRCLIPDARIRLASRIAGFDVEAGE